MATVSLDKAQVIAQSDLLPAFPRTVAEILQTIDDPDGNLHVLVQCIKHDPVIAGRVLALANRAEIRGRREAGLTDLYAATSLIGLRRVREIALISSLQNLGQSAYGGQTTLRIWHHAVAVGVCCEELVLFTDANVPVDSALIAGLLHDVGQLWLYAFSPERSRACWTRASDCTLGIDDAERLEFGVGHAQIGAWLAEHWGLPGTICKAVASHHQPDERDLDAMVAVVHVAEVLANALELGGSHSGHVAHLCAPACRLLGLAWDARTQNLLGRMEARSQHVNAFFAA